MISVQKPRIPPHADGGRAASGNALPGLPAIAPARGGIGASGWAGPSLKAALAVCALGLASAPANADCSDVAIVLAIDASGSISAEEYRLQIMGYHDALMSQAISQSFERAGVVDIAAVLWADSAFAPQIIGWHRVTSGPELWTFAETLAGTERAVNGNTDIGTGLKAAIGLLTEDGLCAERLVIDVSGDGRSTPVSRRETTTSLVAMRGVAKENGIVINALAIRGDDPKLGDYYRQKLMTGIGAFVMEVDGFDTFRDAIAEKLMREVLSGDPVVGSPEAPAILSTGSTPRNLGRV